MERKHRKKSLKIYGSSFRINKATPITDTFGERKLSQFQPQFQAHAFAYAHSQAVSEGLMAYTKGKAYSIRSDYAYAEKPGETVMFQAMLEVAEQDGNDILYVDTVKEFAGSSLSEFKANLTAIEKAKMKIISLSEPHYDLGIGIRDIMEQTALR